MINFLRLLLAVAKGKVLTCLPMGKKGAYEDVGRPACPAGDLDCDHHCPAAAGWAVLWNRLPERMPIYFSLDGQVYGYAAKDFGVLALPSIQVAAQAAVVLPALVVMVAVPTAASYRYARRH